MPKVNFTQVPDSQNFSPMPEGNYLMEVTDVEEKTTKNGDVMFRMKLEVVRGEYRSRCVFDNLTFNEKGMKRVKLVCNRLGIDTDQDIDLDITPEILIGRSALVTLTINDYEANDGTMKKRNEVPFAGYEKVGEQANVEKTIEKAKAQKNISTPKTSPSKKQEEDMPEGDLPF